MDRAYTAVAWGNIAEDEGTIQGTIGRDPNDRLRFRVYDDPEKGKWAVTHWKVLERYGFITVVECRLETGRTHQIRVHMAYKNHPILGDTVYGRAKPELGQTSQCLHAGSLTFRHPRTGEPVTVTCPLPDYFEEVLEKLRGRK
jgi:23S rRNA pseudouridine1911/1915/1917 synthase